MCPWQHRNVGGETLYERRQREQREAEEALDTHPVVREARRWFKHAEILETRPQHSGVQDTKLPPNKHMKKHVLHTCR